MLPMESGQFSILSHTIRQDEAGRFNLSDLHAAAGGEKRHQPSDWLRMQQTQAFIKVLESKIPEPGIPGTEKINDLAPVNIVKGFNGDQGTYVCKRLVYDYAMWVSPEFRYLVLETFDAVLNGRLQEAQELCKLALDGRDAARSVCEWGVRKANRWADTMQQEVIYLHDMLALSGIKPESTLDPKVATRLGITTYGLNGNAPLRKHWSTSNGTAPTVPEEERKARMQNAVAATKKRWESVPEAERKQRMDAVRAAKHPKPL